MQEVTGVRPYGDADHQCPSLHGSKSGLAMIRVIVMAEK
jgi:hypothetical protein